MQRYTAFLRYFFPLIIFLIIVLFLWRGLSIDPRKLPSALINQPAPAFQLPLLNQPGKTFSNQDLLGHVSIINVWASWCMACHAEHPFVMDIARQTAVPIYGVDYKDNDTAAVNYLQQFGNPYALVATDINGQFGMNWGVYGTPETFIVDKQGIIRYRHAGALSARLWQQKILPLIQQLER